jgi:lysozyme
MRTSERGRAIVREFEGLRLNAYLCPANKWTIGYGWTIGVRKGDVWTKEKAEEMLVTGLRVFEDGVLKAIGNAPTTQHQFDAMVSLAYNIGVANFIRSSVLREHKAGNYRAAADNFLKWNKSTVNGALTVLSGLIRRRQAERSLYLEP